MHFYQTSYYLSTQVKINASEQARLHVEVFCLEGNTTTATDENSCCFI